MGKLKIKRKEVDHSLHKHEFRVFSQHREDGIIDFLIRQVGQHSGTFVEFGFGPDQCNCLNLAYNKNFRGLLIDGSKSKCEAAQSAYSLLGKSNIHVVNSFLSRENINQVIKENGFTGEIDVLSIDIDGNDYWLWEAIDVVSPGIVVVEYNASFGPDRSITVPYDPGFVRYDKHSSGFYYGASLAALSHLGSKKGYQLVGCDYSGVNAFFLREDLLNDSIPTSSVTDAYIEHRGRVKYKNIDTPSQFDQVKTMPFVDVSENH